MKRLLAVPILCLCVVGISSAADPQLLGLMMPDAKVLAGANISQVLTSPLGQFLLSQTPLNDPNVQQLLKATGFDPTRDISQIVAASNSAPTQQSGLAAVRGVFDIAHIVEFMKSTGAKVDNSQGVPVVASPDGKGVLAFLDGTLVIAGDPDSVAAAIARRSSPSVLDPALAAKANSLSGSQDAWVVSTLAVPATPSLPLGMDPAAIQNIQQSSAGVKFGSSVVISAEAVEDTPQNATSLANILRMLASLATMNQSNPQMVQISTVLKTLTISTNGTALQLSLSIPEDVIEQLTPASHHKGPRRAALEPAK